MAARQISEDLFARRPVERRKRKPKRTDWLAYRFTGVDGEGRDICKTCGLAGELKPKVDKDGKEGPLYCATCGDENLGHIYTYLCAVDERGALVSDCYNENGLSHDEVCEVLLGIPDECLNFGYMLSYDITKWVEALPDEDKYRLLRPETRKAWKCYECGKSWNVESDNCPHCSSDKFREISDPVRWNGRAYNFFAGPFEVWGHRNPFTGKWLAHTKVWDVIRFFGCAFVQAIADWKVGTPEQHDRIKKMKAKRGSFDKESPEDIKKYCQEECALLGAMMRKVVEGHVEAGWELKAFYGAGSTGKAMLTANNVKEHKGTKLDKLPEGLQVAIMSAFFGGRFENSAVGLIKKKIWSKDIASAYPYAMCSLPCLACGTWRHVPNGKNLLSEIGKAALACVKFQVMSLPDDKRKAIAWAPLPFRDDSGSITYPLNFTGWAWKPEIMQALLGWHGLVKPLEAWVYEKRCDHQPFAFMPDVYRRRVAIGKEGPGLVLKLGANAGYGVTAQSIGDDPPFQEWVWAGNITSSTRGQGLEVIRYEPDPWNILTIATDGICGATDFKVPAPHDTNTYGCKAPDGKVKEPLGGWESEVIDEGMFVAKPGMYFRLNVDIKKLRARGIGRRELFESKDKVIDGFLKWNRRDTKFSVQVQSRRFFGAKSTIYARSRCSRCNVSWPGVPERLCPQCGTIGSSFEAKRQTQVTDESLKDEGRIDVYGTWGLRTIDIRFDPYPKRERVIGKGECSRLHVRDVGGAESCPYLGQKSPEVLNLLPEIEMLDEQPDVEGDIFDVQDLIE